MGITPPKTNMEPQNGGLVQMIFLFKQVIFRFQPLVFGGLCHWFHDIGGSLVKKGSVCSSLNFFLRMRAEDFFVKARCYCYLFFGCNFYDVTVTMLCHHDFSQERWGCL